MDDGELMINNLKKDIGKYNISTLLWVIIILALLVVFFAPYVIVPVGHVGVVFDPFNKGVQSWEMHEGFNLKMPWQQITIYSLRTQTYEMHAGGDDVAIHSLTSEGLGVVVDLTVLYHIDKQNAWRIHKNIGPTYAEIVIKPIVRATMRDLIAHYRAEDLYNTQKRTEFQSKVTQSVKTELAKKNIYIESILVRHIQLPPQLLSSIENKLTAEQDSERMKFVLQKETQEAERKVIEAKGISESNAIIANSLTPSYLTWYWIQSLKEQRSIIYVPVGNNGMPLFKDVDKTEGITNQTNNMNMTPLTDITTYNSTYYQQQSKK